MKKIIYLAFFLLGVCSIVDAQVTIGLNSDPAEGAILQLKNKTATVDGGVNADKGLLLPRVALVAPDLLTIVENPTDADKLNHRGSVVYNMTVDQDAGLDEGIYKWDGEKWSGFRTVYGTLLPYARLFNSAFTLLEECDETLIAGSYYNGQALDSKNYLRLKVNVIIPGSYDLFAQAEDGEGNNNGYYFTASGRFYTAGKHEVCLMGSGTPVTASSAGNEDIIYIYSNDTKLETAPDVFCTRSLWIGDSNVRPKYSMACNSVSVSGVYKKGVSLDSSHTLTLRLNVSSGSEGAPWKISTNEVEGIRFRGSGILGSEEVQEVTLYGEGACENSLSKVLTLSSNSESNQSTCTATVVPVIMEKEIVEIATASGATYGLAGGGDWGPKAMLEDPMNYGDNENSIVKYMGFSSILHAPDASDENLRRWTGATEGVAPADIIVYTFDQRPTSSAQVDLLVDYVNKGGVLIYMDQSKDEFHCELLSKIFGESVADSNLVSIDSTANAAIKMNSSVNDEIINGPFGNCRLGQWGEDFTHTVGLTFLPRNAVVYAGSVVASTGIISTTNVQATIMKHKTKNFFWCGSSGFISSGGEDNTDSGENPFKVASTTIKGMTYPKYPADKMHGIETSVPVCNSTFFANLMAWAVKTAEESGINFGN